MATSAVSHTSGTVGEQRRLDSFYAPVLGEDSILQEQSSKEGLGIDPAIAKALPEGVKVLSIIPHGTGFSTSARINALDAGGKPIRYFIKYGPGDLYRHLIESEHISMDLFVAAAPTFAVHPLARGKFELEDVYFLILEFHNFINADHFTPEQDRTVINALIDLHKSTEPPLSKLGNGKYGMEPFTFRGRDRHYSPWRDTWIESYLDVANGWLEIELDRNGPWPQLESMWKRMTVTVVPRLLNALVDPKPCLTHGDLWGGNLAIDAETGLPKVFDGGANWCHWEKDMSMWRSTMAKIPPGCDYPKRWLDGYIQARGGWAEPAEEGEDRLMLYWISDDFNFASHWPSWRGFVGEMGIKNMRRLLEKYDPEWVVDHSPIVVCPAVSKEERAAAADAAANAPAVIVPPAAPATAVVA